MNDVIRIEREDGRFVEGKAKMTYGFKRKIKNLQRPDRMRYKGDDDIIMDLPEYDEKKDPDILILANQLTAWSKDEKITLNSILNDEDLGDLFDEFLDKVREINGLRVDAGKSNS